MGQVYTTIYFFAEEKRMQQAHFFKANPDLKTAISVWNMLDEYALVLKMILPKIKNHHLLHVPKLQEKLTLESIRSIENLRIVKSDPENSAINY